MTDRTDGPPAENVVTGAVRASEPSGAPAVSEATGAVSGDGDLDPGELHPLRRIVRVLAMLVFAYVMVVEVILLIGFVCLLFGIEPASWFVDIVYRSVDRTMQPFESLFTAVEFGTASSEEVQPRIESSIVFAMIVYGIIALAVHDLAEWVGRPRRPEPTPT